MKRTAVVLGSLLLMGLTGCATEEYVRTQVDPLADRIGKLEQMVKANAMTDEADRAAIKEANDKAQQANDAVKKVATEVKSANQDVQKAEAAAQRAENAAAEATKAAENAKMMEKKTEKIFKLEQKK